MIMPRIIVMISTEGVKSLLWFIRTHKVVKFSGHRSGLQIIVSKSRNVLSITKTNWLETN